MRPLLLLPLFGNAAAWCAGPSPRLPSMQTQVLPRVTCPPKAAFEDFLHAFLQQAFPSSPRRHAALERLAREVACFDKHLLEATVIAPLPLIPLAFYANYLIPSYGPAAGAAMYAVWVLPEFYAVSGWLICMRIGAEATRQLQHLEPLPRPLSKSALLTGFLRLHLRGYEPERIAVERTASSHPEKRLAVDELHDL